MSRPFFRRSLLTPFTANCPLTRFPALLGPVMFDSLERYETSRMQKVDPPNNWRKAEMIRRTHFPSLIPILGSTQQSYCTSQKSNLGYPDIRSL